jgi:hypothetical protein
LWDLANKRITKQKKRAGQWRVKTKQVDLKQEKICRLIGDPPKRRETRIPERESLSNTFHINTKSKTQLFGVFP